MANQPQDMLDIIFETRNKAYGAYFLRRSYPTFMRNALLLGVAFIALVFAFPVILSAVRDILPKPKIDVIAELGPPPEIDPNTPPPPPPPPVQTPPPPPKATIKFVPPVVKKDEEVKEEKIMEEVKDITVEVAKKTVEGVEKPEEIIENEPSDLGKVEVVKVDKPEEPLTFVEAMPTFPGGEVELLRYLGTNIKYPNVAKETGIQGKVFLSFVVEKNGKITDIKIVRDIGGGCGKEAVRVVESMPQWKPGNQNGNAVRVRMNLPVTFRLE